MDPNRSPPPTEDQFYPTPKETLQTPNSTVRMVLITEQENIFYFITS